jgi:hypothetical protein
MATSPVVRATVTALQLSTNITFHGWKGWIPSMQVVLNRYVRQGATGSGAEQTGTLGRPVSISAWRIEADPATATNNIGVWESFEGLVCQVVDPWGRSLPRVRLTDCAGGPPIAGRGPLAEGGTQGLYLVTFTATAERLPDASS